MLTIETNELLLDCKYVILAQLLITLIISRLRLFC